MRCGSRLFHITVSIRANYDKALGVLQSFLKSQSNCFYISFQIHYFTIHVCIFFFCGQLNGQIRGINRWMGYKMFGTAFNAWPIFNILYHYIFFFYLSISPSLPNQYSTVISLQCSNAVKSNEFFMSSPHSYPMG